LLARFEPWLSEGVMPVNGARTAVDILRKNNINADLLEFKSGHHGIFTNMKTAITHAVEQSLPEK
jgi:hypothetical protein